MAVGEAQQRRDVLVDDQDRLAARLERASTRQISARMRGASPSVASSRINRRGLVISARPIASICCSPPESSAPRLRPPLAQPRKQLEHAHRGPRGRPVAAVATQVLAHGQVREDLPALGHEAEPEPRDAVGGRPGSTRRRSRIVPALRRGHAHDRAHRRGLAHAVAAEQRHDLAGARRCSSTPNSTRPSP